MSDLTLVEAVKRLRDCVSDPERGLNRKSVIGSIELILSTLDRAAEVLGDLADKLSDRWDHLDCEDGNCDLQEALTRAHDLHQQLTQPSVGGRRDTIEDHPNAR